MKKMKIGIIGCGNISQAYFKGASMFDILEIKACADINHEAAKAKAEENDVEVMSVDQILTDTDIEIIVNLTIPSVHAEVNTMILEAGKHVHLEKPLAIDLGDAKKVLNLAEKKGLRIGCAPDTFLGAGLQTCRKLLDDGWIGCPLSGTAFFLGHGPEAWHPNPDFFYLPGGGPMLDLGPYYITALIHLLGPVKKVKAMTAKGSDTRFITSEQHFGKELPVEVPTHYTGILEFVSGAIITIAVSFDVWGHGHSPIEIYGSEGSLKVPDPNTFGNDISLLRKDEQEWEQMPYSHCYWENSRGIGVADMAYGIRTGRAHRCSGELAYHALEVMFSFEKSSESGADVIIESSCKRPQALPVGLIPGFLDK